MKKMLLIAFIAITLFSTEILAGENLDKDALNTESFGFYVGLDVLKDSHSFTADSHKLSSFSTNIDSNSFKIKLGATTDNGWRLQGYVEFITYDETLFDASNDELLEFGIEVIKGFQIAPKWSPFIQVGMGSGVMTIEGYDEDSISEFNFKIGIGVAYKIIPAFELIAGADLQYRTWQDISFLSADFLETYTVSIHETNTKLYVGANFHF